MNKKYKCDNLDAPVFIVGSMRSGTTLLRLMVDHHSKINCFGEFEQSVSQAVGDEWPDLQQYYNFLKTDRQAQGHNFSIDKALNYEGLVRSFVTQADERGSGTIISAVIHSRIDLIPKIWPAAKYVHLVRDPRDVARSCIGMGWVGNAYEGVNYWIEAETRWNRINSKINNKDIYELKYEDLVKNPEAELNKLCGFLNIMYEPSMLEIGKDTTYSKPDASYATQWKEKMTELEVGWVENCCKELMLNRGYNLSGYPVLKPTFLTLIKLKFQNRIYRVSFNIRRWGVINWFGFVVSKKLKCSRIKDFFQEKINAIDRELIK
jgi:Sulfotransferase family